MKMLYIGFIGLALLFFACGQNAFESSEPSDPAEDATIALENDDPDGAIEILETELENDPGNPQLLSILSLAYAQRAGVEPLEFAQNFSKNAGNTESNSQFTILFAIMPDPTASNISDIDQAVSILNSIPLEDRLPGDAFKLAMFNTAAVVLRTKAFDADLDGDLTAEELANLSDEDAAALLAQINLAGEQLGQSADGSESNQKAQEAFDNFTSELNSADGSTEGEKLKNFLEADGNQTDAATE